MERYDLTRLRTFARKVRSSIARIFSGPGGMRFRVFVREPAFFFLFSLIYWECVFRGLTGGAARHALTSILWAVPLSLGLALLCSLFRTPKAGRICCFVLTVLNYVIYGSQFIYYRIFETYYTWFSALNGAAALTDFYREALAAIGRNLHWLLLMGLPLWYLIIRGRKVLRFGAPRKLRKLGLAFLAAYSLFLLSLVFQGTGQFTPFDLYYRRDSLNYSMERLGVAATVRIDLERMAIGWEPAGAGASIEMTPPVIEEPEPGTQTAEMPSSEAEPSATAPEPVPETKPVEYGDNVLEIDFTALAAAETNATLKNMHEYFAAQTPTKKNEMTGIFQGCNLVMMTCEGFSQYVVDPVRTPTLYKMMTKGINFTNFYTPIWSVSTSDGEYVACQGLIPKSGVWSFKNQAKIIFPLLWGINSPRRAIKPVLIMTTPTRITGVTSLIRTWAIPIWASATD